MFKGNAKSLAHDILQNFEHEAKKHFYRIRFIIQSNDEDYKKILKSKEMEFRSSDGNLRQDQSQQL